MKLIWKFRHLFSLALAYFLVNVFDINHWDVQKLVGPINDRWFQDYTSYFPGLDGVQGHEIFSPKYASKKKIVLLGASATDAIGCDRSWSYPDQTQNPPENAHYYCTIANQMNMALKKSNQNEWHVFNLARNGANLTPMLYVYAQILELKPEIVVYGDTYAYYNYANAGAGELNPTQYAYLDKVFKKDPEIYKLWEDYLKTLKENGLILPKELPKSEGKPVPTFVPRQSTSIAQLVDRLLIDLKNQVIVDGPPLEPKIHNLDLKQPTEGAHWIADPGFHYLNGIAVIAALQKKHNGKLFFYFSPQGSWSKAPGYYNGIGNDYQTYFEDKGISWANLISLDLALGLETYDSVHQTVYGNKRIASVLLSNLRGKGLMQ